VALCTWAYRIEPHPYALLSRRLVLIGAAAFTLLSLAMLAAVERVGLVVGVSAAGPAVWALFFAMVLLLLPLLWRSQELMREFSTFTMVAISAMALDLLLVGVLAMEPVASLSLTAFGTLGLYAALRRRQLGRLAERQMADAGRRVDRLHRVVREVEAHPQQCEPLTLELLRDLFGPLDLQRVGRAVPRARVIADGAALQVPLPDRDASTAASLTLRFADHGRRLFTHEDARLADQVVEQLRRALAQQQAVERGRSEERARIAQDLHDDIGARLLTLMYQAPTAEMEDYVRHTLKDLKTLTRGLASDEHRLSHAVAEWKADIAQRLQAAQIELAWSFEYDRDIVLSVVQWSALTRVLRELVSNVIQHSAATHVEVAARLRDGGLRLSLSDDGIGREPQRWAHGLGLGGVRKRAKLLAGEVHWSANDPSGIVCTLLVPALAGPGS
jgi:signal transduction histidine kinase